MNAYELAEGILAIEERIFLTRQEHKLFQNSANMLRQQADRIADLEKQVEHYKNKAEALDKRELELLAEIRSLEKDLYMIQRHYDQLDTQLHPESTK